MISSPQNIISPVVALIGAGQIGCRHLQSLVVSEIAKQIYIVDPQPKSRQLVKDRLAEVGVTDHQNIVLEDNAAGLPAHIDVAIIATGSLDRIETLRDLLTNCKPRYLVLEKFLFPRLDDYRQASQLLQKTGVVTYVNCPRRLYQGYQDLKNKLTGKIRITVSGSKWGLACNSVHWLDLLNYLRPGGNYKASCTLSPPSQTKRPDYIEFFGRIDVVDDADNQLTLECNEHGPPSVEIVIEDAQGNAWKIDEQEKQVISGHEKLVFPVPFQSQLTAGVVENLLSTGDCNLSPYHVSADLHQLLLSEFLGHYNRSILRPENDLCPIT